ncbi:hypothetical protein [Streptosporangium saharense]|uniref:Conjugal transfer protein TraI n=1 Tax=Streptosporangium saharense TaxID=1706840 RepID=A0A7W7QGR4_9ACTN|nr:hypothetical protein [Streptosporangium saharense]MBB4913337.1 hypothetical protein [Streptosporangium saharense]
MSLITPTPDPDEVSRGLAALEHHLAQHPPPLPAADVPDQTDREEVSGETARVRRLRAEVAEARRLAELQDDDTPLLVESARVRRLRQAAHEAGRLAELAQDPAMRIYQSMRVRRLLVGVALTALTLALAWSTAGVQAFAADGAPVGSPVWWFAWLVEPFLSLALLVVVGARAYLGTRGHILHDRSLIKVERLFLTLTVGMNAWPYLPLVTETFNLARLVLHILGPVVAVAITTALPIILAAFSHLDQPTPTGAPTGPTYRTNTELVNRVRALIQIGELPDSPSATRIQRTLRCGMDDARAVRDALAGGA